MKILELFSGYGTASFALKQLGIPYELVGYSDIDKYANECFRNNHCPVDMDRKLGDVRKIDPSNLDDFDLLTGGFPCQSFSNAGKGLGELDARGTLFNDIIRIAEVKKPRYMLLENVRGLVSKKHIGTFNKIMAELKRIGYYVDWKILNTKDYGIPHNRERVFFACFRNATDYSKFHINGGFPEKEELKLFLKDIIDSGEVDRDTSYCIDANYFKGTSLKGYLEKCRRQIVFEEGLCVPNATVKGYDFGRPGDGVNLDFPTSKTRRGRITKKVSGALQCNGGRGVILDDYKIRKLTPTECFRLQGFLNDEVILDGISNSQQYKLAGNGQSVNVVKKIFEKMFNCSPNLKNGCGKFLTGESHHIGETYCDGNPFLCEECRNTTSFLNKTPKGELQTQNSGSEHGLGHNKETKDGI